jgi:hypothetical protein
MWQLVRKRNSDASRASPNVRDPQRRTWETGFHIYLDSTRSEAFERDFDDMFRFRARDEHGKRNFEFESPEFLLASKVLRRFACRSACDEREIAIHRCGFKLVFGMGVDPSAVALEDVHQQELRGERMRGDLGCAKIRHRLP